MKKMTNRILAMLIAVLLVVSLCGCGTTAPAPTAEAPASDAPAAGTPASDAPAVEAPAADEEEFNLSMATFFGAANQHEIPLTWICNQMYERSGGTIKTEYYGSSTLLDPSGMLEGIKSGMADIGIIQLGDYPGRFPELGLSEIPGMYFASSPAYGHALNEYYQTYAPAELDGVVVLTFECGTTGVLCSNKGPVHSPADLKGQTIRALGNAAKSVGALGGTPADVSIADCYESLRTGVLDGILTLRGALDGFKLCEVVDHAMNYTLYNSSTIWIMNADKFNSMSDRQKEAVMSAWTEGGEMMLSRLPDDINCCSSLPAAIAQVEDYYYPTEEETAAFQQLLLPIVEEYANGLSGQGFDGQEILGRWNALAEKWNAEYPYKAPDDADYYVMTYPDTQERVFTDGLSWAPAY